MQAQAVGLGWYVYKQTGSAFALGLLGLVQFLPAIPLTILTRPCRRPFRPAHGGAGLAPGRRRPGRGARCPLHQSSAMPGACGRASSPLFLIGCARPFTSPALRAMLPSLVERSGLSRAVALSSSANQLAVIVGPSLGGVAYAAIGPGDRVPDGRGADRRRPVSSCGPRGSPAVPWSPAAPAPGSAPSPASPTSARTGFLLGAMSLDLLACLVGGSLRSCTIFTPATSSTLGRRALAFWPPRTGDRRGHRRPGAGAATAQACGDVDAVVRGRLWPGYRRVRVFGQLLVVDGALIVLGGCDMVSIVVRQTLVRVATPDAMLGRVLAVNSTLRQPSPTDWGISRAGSWPDWSALGAAGVAGGDRRARNTYSHASDRQPFSGTAQGRPPRPAKLNPFAAKENKGLATRFAGAPFCPLTRPTAAT